MTVRFPIAVALVATLWLGMDLALADNMNDLEGLLGESVVSTASKSAERASEAPSQIITISADELRLFGIRSVDEALNYLGVGVHAAPVTEAQSYSGVSEEIGTRGVLFTDGGSRVLVLLDGHLTNSQIDGRSFLNAALGVPIEAVDHIEVMLGPGSVMYGTSAFLGVVNVVTRRARDARGFAATAQLMLQPPQGDDRNLTSVGNGDSLGVTYRLAASLGQEFTLLGQAGEITAYAEWQSGSSGSFRVGPQSGALPEGVVSRSGSPWQGAVHNTVSAPTLLAALRLGEWRLALHLNSHDRGAPLIGGLGIPHNGGSVRHLGLDLRNSAQLGSRVTLSSRLYADVTEQSVTEEIAIDQSPEFAYGFASTERRLSQWLGLEEQATVSWLHDERLITTLGFDARGRRSQATFGRYDPQTGAASQLVPTATIDSLAALGGLYLQQVYRPWSWLSVNGGVRLDLDQLFGWHLSPRAALVLTPWKNNSIKLLYAEAFRAPTPEDVSGWSFTGQIQPSALRPELERSVELQVSQRWSSGRIEINGFASFFYDLISSRVPTSDEFQAALAARRALPILAPSDFLILANLGTLRSYGGSLRIEQRLPRGLSTGANLLIAHVDAANQDGTPAPPLTITPTVFGNARLLYQPRPGGFGLGLVASVLGPRCSYQAGSASAIPINLGPSADLRLTGSLPLPAGSPLRGLALRLIADYNTEGRAPVEVGGPSQRAPTQAAELAPLPRAFFLAEVRYER